MLACRARWFAEQCCFVSSSVGFLVYKTLVLLCFMAVACSKHCFQVDSSMGGHRAAKLCLLMLFQPLASLSLPTFTASIEAVCGWLVVVFSHVCVCHVDFFIAAFVSSQW